MGEDVHAFFYTIVVATLYQQLIYLFISTQINSFMFTSYRQTYISI